jgi:hypothetical protein
MNMQTYGLMYKLLVREYNVLSRELDLAIANKDISKAVDMAVAIQEVRDAKDCLRKLAELGGLS